MRRSSIFFLLLALLTAVPLNRTWGQASPAPQPDIVVEGTKTGTPIEQLTGGVTIIDEATIRTMHVETVLDVLRQVEGVDVVRAGGPGGQTSLFIRGGNSNHVLVLIDGIKVNSPTTGAFDLSHLTVDQVERIEVLRGTQSPLYGTDATAGVVNIVTKRGRPQERDTLTLEGGSYGTRRGVLTHTGRGPMWDRTWAISRWDSRGFSRASEDRGNTEPDGYANTTLSMKLGRAAGVGGRADLSLRLTDATTDIDTFASTPPFLPVDGSDKSRNKQAVAGLTIAAPLTARWDHRLVVGWSRDHLTTPGSTDLDAQSRQLDWQHTLGLGSDNLLTVGYEYQHRFAAISTAGEQKIIANAFYAQDQLAAFDPLFITVGGRTDDTNRFDRHNTYKAGASLNLARLQSRVFGNYGTGFRGPTLNDLYFPGFSNPNLRPEESSGYEAGVSIDIVPRALTLGATYFRTDYDDLIAVNSSFVPDNVKNAEVRGVEVSGALRAPKASIEGSYTYTSTRDGSTNDQLLRRPRNKGALALIFEPERDTNLRVDARYVGERLDFGSTLPSYLVVNLAASQRMGPHVEWFVRADNVFDRDYEEVTGYGTAGRSIYGGLTATF